MEISQNIPKYILEYNNFQFNINVQLENNSEQEEIIKSIKITPQLQKDSVKITEGIDSTISGVYKEVFKLGQGQLKTVRRADKQVHNYSRFDELPKNKTEDLFKFKPPQSLDYPIQFNCKVIYDKKIISSSESGQPQETIQKDLTYEKQFSTVIKGSWDIWQKALREYIKEYST